MILEARQNTKVVGNGIATEPEVRRTGRLLLRRTLKEASRWGWLLLTCGQSLAGNDLNEGESSANSKIHCQIP